jgi:uncharacterized membrane protein
MDEGTRATIEPRAVDGGRGITWWSEAWALFMKNPGLWVVFGLILFVVFLVLGFIPLIGALAACLAAPVFIGSWMLAARKVDTGGTLEVGDLFTGFRGDKLQPLLLLGALLLAAALVIGLLVGALGFGSAMGMMVGGAHSSAGMAAAMGAGMLAMLVTTVLGFVVAMAFWYAPALVVLRGVAPVDAAKASFYASLKNIIAFLLYGIIYIVAAIVASIPFGLGWIVLIPVVMLSIYVSYQDVFA